MPPAVAPAAHVRSAGPGDGRAASHSVQPRSGSASPPDSGPAPLPRPLGPRPFFFFSSLSPFLCCSLPPPVEKASHEHARRRPRPVRAVRRGAQLQRLDGASGAAAAAAPGSRRSRRRRRRRRRCNGRLHLLLLPQRPLRRESYITRGQSLLGNVVPPGLLLKGDWAESSGGKSGRARGPLRAASVFAGPRRDQSGFAHRVQGTDHGFTNAWGGRVLGMQLSPLLF